MRTFTQSPQRASCSGKLLNRLRNELFQCRLVMLATIVFQACSFNHSDISPFRIRDLQSQLSPATGNCVRPPNVRRSLTVISSIAAGTPMWGRRGSENPVVEEAESGPAVAALDRDLRLGGNPETHDYTAAAPWRKLRQGARALRRQPRGAGLRLYRLLHVLGGHRRVRHFLSLAVLRRRCPPSVRRFRRCARIARRLSGLGSRRGKRRARAAWR